MSQTIESDPGKTGRGAGWLADRSLRFKILSAVGLMAVVGLAVEAVALSRMASMNASTKAIYNGNLIPVQEIDDVGLNIAQVRVAMLRHATATTAANKATLETAITEADAEVNTALDAYAAHPADAGKLDQLRSVWGQYTSARDSQLIPVSRRGDLAEFSRIQVSVTTPLAEQAEKLAWELGELETADARAQLDESTSAYDSARVLTLAIFLVGLALAIGLTLLVVRAVVGAVTKVAGVVSGLAEGDLTRSAGVRSRDEIGRMSMGLDAAVARLRDALRTVGGSSDALAGAAEQLSATSAQIAESAGQTGSRAESVAATSSEISYNVQAVAAGTEEMGAAIREIASSAAEAAGVTQRAVGLADTANSTITRLGESSVEIGTVVKLITSIAEQTNLLALNATIEAARAGELGKGFAVVAGEVKDLAQATSKATEDISHRIKTIQAESSAAVAAITQVSEVIAQVDGYSATIASAVEEQSATTSEMARNVSGVASGSGEIASTITGVAAAAELTTTGAAESQAASTDLARMASELQTLVGRFRV